MAIDIESVRKYCRIDDEGDELVEGLVASASAYIIGAIEEKRAAVLEADHVYLLCVKMLVSLWHDNPAMVGQPVHELPYGIGSLLSHLANKEYPAPEPEEVTP
jgi:uncharacterized phage protein (predicted DNA packaging)